MEHVLLPRCHAVQDCAGQGPGESSSPCVRPASWEGSRKVISADPAWPFLLTLEFALSVIAWGGDAVGVGVLEEPIHNWRLTDTTSAGCSGHRVGGDGVWERGL